MAYTNVWSDTTPTGSEAANTIDDIFRSLKVDIQQRFIDIFAMPNFTDDPLRPYGLKFTDAQDAVISMGDNGGTPRSVLWKNKAGSVTYLTLSSIGLTLPNGQHYFAVRNTGSAAINVLGFESGTDNLVTVLSLNWFIKDTGNITRITFTEAGAATFSQLITGNNGLTISSGTSALQAVTATTVTATGAIAAGAASSFIFTGRSQIVSPADGQLLLYNNAGNNFARLQFGGTTSSFPSLKRSSTEIQARLSDDSNFSPFQAGLITGQQLFISGTTIFSDDTTVSGGLFIVVGLPTSASGLPSGAFWNNGGVVNVAP